MDEKKITFSNYKSASAPMTVFDPSAKEDDYIEVSEWPSGEGINVSIGDRYFALSLDELEAIVFLKNCIYHHEAVIKAENY